MVVRPLQVQDMPQMVELLATRDELDRKGAERRAAILEWVAFRNPFREEGEPTYYVIEEEGRILAMHGRMPVLFSFNGSMKRGYYVHDLYVHREAREKGKGFWMTMALARAIEQETDSFISLVGMTPLNLEMQRRRPYKELRFDSLAKLLRPDEALLRYLHSESIVRLLSPVGRWMLRFLDTLRLPGRKGELTVSHVSRFDGRFDELFKRVAPKIGFCTAKTSAYLNWKYGEGPSRNDTVLAAAADDMLRGFLVAGFSPHSGGRAGLIKDFIVDPADDEAVSALMRAAIDHFRVCDAHSIRVIASDPRFGAIFRKYLFVRMKEPVPVFLGNVDRAPVDPLVLLENRNWHVMVGESDIFMFSGGIPPEKENMATGGKRVFLKD